MYHNRLPTGLRNRRPVQRGSYGVDEEHYGELGRYVAQPRGLAMDGWYAGAAPTNRYALPRKVL